MMREAVRAGARGYVVKSDAARDLLAAVDAISQHKFFDAQQRGHLADTE
jgi:DNA-binding NarL/FixJ family response regulator